MTLAMNVGLMGSPKDPIEHGADRENGVPAIAVGPMSPMPDASDRENRAACSSKTNHPHGPYGSYASCVHREDWSRAARVRTP
jgi:hypothetical protein